jgi:hypothetical protein
MEGGKPLESHRTIDTEVQSHNAVIVVISSAPNQSRCFRPVNQSDCGVMTQE